MWSMMESGEYCLRSIGHNCNKKSFMLEAIRAVKKQNYHIVDIDSDILSQ